MGKVTLITLALVTCFIGIGANTLTEKNSRNVQNVKADTEGERCEACKLSREYLAFTDLTFDARSVPADDATCLALKMFIEMGFVDQFNIPTSTLYRFIQRVQTGYRNVPYHGWSHGFSVLHFVFGVLKNYKLIEKQHLTPFEGLALMTAAMCHDLDHPGTNNQFQIDTNSPLAVQYGKLGSILERHHIAQTFNLLSNSENNFISHLSKEQSDNFKEIITQCILATDLPLHMKQVGTEQSMASGGYNPNNVTHRAFLRANIISCGDFNDQIKGWPVLRLNVEKLYSEFFAQGDSQKNIGQIPLEMMDREKANIPKINEDFIRNVVVPDYQVLVTMYPESIVLMKILQRNIVYWQKSKPYFEEQIKLGRPRLSILLDKNLDFVST